MAGPKLIRKRSDGTAVDYPLRAATRIGRADDNDVSLNDGMISKHHAIVEFLNNDWIVRDLGSSNGVILNGKRIKVARLKVGDLVRLGSVLLEFVQDGSYDPDSETSFKILEQENDRVVHQVPAVQEAFRPERNIADARIIRSDYERLRVAHEFAATLGTLGDESDLFQRLLGFCAKLLDARSGVVVELTSEALWERAALGNVALSRSVLDEIFRTKSGMLVADAQSDQRLAASHSIEGLGLRSVLAAPIIVGDRVAAALVLENNEHTGAFHVGDLHLVTGIAAEAAAALDRLRQFQKSQDEARGRQDLSRFLPDHLVQAVLGGTLDLPKNGREETAVVLHLQIHGVSRALTSLGAEPTLRVLNELATVMVETIFDHGGLLEQLRGDGLSAVFGLPTTSGEDAVRATRCALDLQMRVEIANVQRMVKALPVLPIAIGLWAGPVLFGRVGASRRLDYAVVGEAVERASMLAAMADHREILGPLAMLEPLTKEFTIMPRPPAVLERGGEPVPIVAVRGLIGGEETTMALPRFPVA